MAKKDTQVFSIQGNLDLTNFFSEYKKMLQTLRTQGGEISSLNNLEKLFEKLEHRLQNLQAEGKQEFFDSKSIAKFQQKVRDFESDLKNTTQQLKDFASNSNNFSNVGLKEAQQTAVNLTKEIERINALQKQQIENQLRSLGFSQKDIKNVSSRIKLEENLTEEIEAQARARYAMVNTLYAERDQQVQQAGISSYKKLTNRELGITGQSKEERVALSAGINRIAQEGSRTGATAQIIVDQIKREYGSLINLFNNIETIEASINNLINRRDANIQRINSEMEPQIRMAEQYARQLGFYNAGGDFVLSEDSNNAIQQVPFERNAQSLERLQQMLGIATQNINRLTNAQANFNQTSAENVRRIDEQNNGLNRMSENYHSVITEQINTARATERLNHSFDNMGIYVRNILSITSAFAGLRRVITQTFNDVKELDKSFAEIAMVTDYSVGEMWKSYGQYAEMANQLGQSTKSVIQASGLYYQQGLDTAESLELTKDTMKLATLAGLDFKEATSQMTSALRGFKMEMDEGARVTDVYSELAAKAAADVEGIAYAMSKTSSIANSAGMSFENTAAFLTQMIDVIKKLQQSLIIVILY